MRFQLTPVLDAIERRLTTDVVAAQAVVDLGEVVRQVELDHGRPVTLVRIGMVVDALSRYLVDGGATLYGVVGRDLLSESALTSKERMVLGRWADDGVIEVAPVIGDRVVEVAHLTGLPVITVRPFDDDLVKRYAWLAGGGGRVLRLMPRAGSAALSPMNGAEPAGSAEPVIGRASVPKPAEPKADDAGDADEADEAAESKGDEAAEPGLPERVFAVPVARIRISWRRFLRGEPDRAHAHLLRRTWRCDAFECPAFGESRRIGQPVPRLRANVPSCPRHDQPVRDVGPRPPAYPVSIVVDDLPRRRLVVRSGQPVTVGRDTDDEDVVSVATWLHQAASNWISLVHLRLEACDDGLVAFDLSDNGTVIWQRKGPDDPGTARPLHHDSYTLGEWDSVELYTGVELMLGDRRRAALIGRAELSSVLVDAPTAAHHELSQATGRAG